MSENENDIPQDRQKLRLGETYLTAWVIELEARVRHLEGKMERAAYILSEPGRTEDLSKVVRAVEFVLREPYAVREPDRPSKPSVPISAGAGVAYFKWQVSAWVHNSTPCVRGLLLSELRKILDSYGEVPTKYESLRVHPSATELQDRANRFTSELLRGMDTVERRRKLTCWCGSEHVSKHGPKRRAGDWTYVPGTSWQNQIVQHVWPVLERTTSDKIPATLNIKTRFGLWNRSGKDRRISQDKYCWPGRRTTIKDRRGTR